MKTLDNLKLISRRITKVAVTPPAKPLRGRGYDRRELKLEHVFAILQKRAPLHCDIVTERGPVNGYGKLGYIPHSYISLELSEVIEANQTDFEKLNAAIALVQEFSL